MFGAEEILRFPDDGPAFCVGLRVGHSELGIASDAGVYAGTAGRLLVNLTQQL